MKKNKEKDITMKLTWDDDKEENTKKKEERKKEGKSNKWRQKDSNDKNKNKNITLRKK